MTYAKIITETRLDYFQCPPNIIKPRPNTLEREATNAGYYPLERNEQPAENMEDYYKLIQGVIVQNWREIEEPEKVATQENGQ